MTRYWRGEGEHFDELVGVIKVTSQQRAELLEVKQRHEREILREMI
ncbi:hypothetical protein [Faecalimonas umbilicata]